MNNLIHTIRGTFKELRNISLMYRFNGLKGEYFILDEQSEAVGKAITAFLLAD